jgi:hypothetical protein
MMAMKLHIMIYDTLEDLVFSVSELHSLYKIQFPDGRFGYYFYSAEKPLFMLRIVFTSQDLNGWLVFDRERNKMIQVPRHSTGAIWICKVEYDSFLNEFLQFARQQLENIYKQQFKQ